MTILIFLAVLLLLVIVHEFGHFSVAKIFGVRVDEFGVGFPPRIAGIKRGETEYTINALPFGGFVRIFGENPDEESLTGPDRTRSMVNKPRLVQAAVLFAGVFFNILLAWFFFTGTLIAGTPAIALSEYDRYLSHEEIVVTSLILGAPAEAAGITPGDRIRSITAAGETLTPERVEDVITFIGTHAGEEMVIEVERGGATETAVVTAKTGIISEDPGAAAIGVGMARVGELTLPIHLALWEGLQKTGVMLYQVAVGLGTFFLDAFLFNADFSDIAGPVGIVNLVGDASALGLVALVNFTALISLNLAIVNLIPFPALDGGRLLFLGIEAMKGSPIRPQVANAFNTVGFALLVLLMVAVTYNDIVRLVS